MLAYSSFRKYVSWADLLSNGYTSNGIYFQQDMTRRDRAGRERAGRDEMGSGTGHGTGRDRAGHALFISSIDVYVDS